MLYESTTSHMICCSCEIPSPRSVLELEARERRENVLAQFGKGTRRFYYSGATASPLTETAEEEEGTAINLNSLPGDALAG